MGMYVVKNTFLDRTKTHLHRKAPGLQPEPTIGGVKLKIGHFLKLTEKQYQINETLLKKLESFGLVDIIAPSSEAPPTKTKKVEAVESAPPLVEDVQVEVAPVEETPAQPKIEVVPKKRRGRRPKNKKKE